ncbi:hypothetical protein MXB_1264 [Myxobolus squamalis]|nr:hypothetical protein MXB_1264 [Myxobolus squamalis]
MMMMMKKPQYIFIQIIKQKNKKSSGKINDRRRTSSSSRCKTQIHHKLGRKRRIQISAKILSLKSLLFCILYKKKYTKDKDEDILKQNFAQHTLEDHFDKSMLPEVMHIKNFGKITLNIPILSIRTRYALKEHRVKKTSCLAFFSTKIGGGIKQTFYRAATKRKKYN